MPKTASLSLTDVYLCRRSNRATYYAKSSLHFWLNRFGGWGRGGGGGYGSFVCMLGAGVGGRIPFTYIALIDYLFMDAKLTGLKVDIEMTMLSPHFKIHFMCCCQCLLSEQEFPCHCPSGTKCSVRIAVG